MKSDTIKKINKLGKVGYVISKIGCVALMIAAFMGLAFGVVMCLVPKEAVQIELYTANSAVVRLDNSIDIVKNLDLGASDGILEVGDTTYKLVMSDSDEPAEVKTVLYLSNVKWLLFGSVIACCAAFIAFRYACKLCAYFRDCETPFSEESSKCLVNLAWSLVPLCVITPLMEMAVDAFAAGTADISVTIDLTTILLVLCVFMLSYIFKHGAALQTESDETL